MARGLLKFTLRPLHPASPDLGETAMNPIPSNNSLPASRDAATCHAKRDFDVNLPEIAFSDFSEAMDDELAKLETHFKGFVTSRSQKRSFGR
jgi:hypothetical protein